MCLFFSRSFTLQENEWSKVEAKTLALQRKQALGYRCRPLGTDRFHNRYLIMPVVHALVVESVRGDFITKVAN